MNQNSKIIIKYKKLSEPVKASLWYTICSVMQKGVALLTVPIFTRIMSQSEYGIFTLYQSWFNIFILVVSLNLHLAVFSRAMIKFEDDRDKYLSSMQGITTTVAVCLLLVFVLWRDVFAKYTGIDEKIFLIMLIDLVFYPAFNFWSAKQRFEFEYKKLVLVTLLVTIFSSVFGVISVILFNGSSFARIYSLAIVEIIVYSGIWINNFRNGRCFFNRNYWKYSISFCIPLLPHYLAGVLLNQADRIMIDMYEGKEKAAVYGVAYSSAMLVLLFVNAINASFTPWLFNKLKKKEYSNISSTAFKLIAGVCVVNSVLVLFAPEIMKILGGKEYSEAAWIFPIISASCCFIFLYNFFADIEFYFEKKYFISFSSVSSAFLNIILNMIFIPRYGYFVAAYTTLFSYVLYSFLHAIFMRVILKRENVEHKIYNVNAMFFVCFCVNAWAIICCFLFKNMMIRNILLVLIFILMLIFRKKIVDFLLMLLGELKKKE